MTKRLDAKGRKLLTKMRAISISSFGEAWVPKLEFALWLAIRNDGLRAYGFDVSSEQSARLNELSIACAGWYTDEDSTELTWMPRVDWMMLFERACPMIYRDLLLKPSAIENAAQVESREQFLKSPAVLTILECRRRELSLIETVRITRGEHQLGLAESQKLLALVDNSDWNALLHRQNKFY